MGLCPVKDVSDLPTPCQSSNTVLAPKPLVQRTAHRMGDFFAVNAPWQRRLWSTSIPMSLRELAEVSSAVADRTISQGALRWYAQRLVGQISRDPGVGGPRQAEELRRCLQSDVIAGSLEHRELQQIAADIREQYLERWAVALENESHGFNAERIARSVASHLLDTGLSQNHLHRWLSWSRERDPVVHDLPSLVRRAEDFARRPEKQYRVLVPMLSPFPVGNAEPAEWLRAERALVWLRQTGLAELAGVEPSGALLLRVRASDPEAAVERAANIVDALIARSEVGTRSPLRAHSDAFVAGSKRRFPLRRSRRVEVRALEREGLLAADLYELPRDAIDSTLQLVSHLDSGPPEVAVAGGWSAIESILTGPGVAQNVEAGDRLGAIVACSWPRAELTTLAWERIRAIDDALSSELVNYPDNRARAERIGTAVHTGEWLGLTSPSAVCAIRRLEKLYRAPRETLLEVQAYAIDAVRRLYRNRNLVLHGGHTRAVTLSSSLRTVAPLVGAGVDRIVHAYITAAVHPLELAARARLEIERCGDTERPLTRLLE